MTMDTKSNSFNFSNEIFDQVNSKANEATVFI